MPRIVKLTATGPVKIEPGHEKPVWICACGLSQTFPICDGSHKQCKVTELDPSATYVYDDERKNIIETRSPGGSESPGE